MCNTQCGNDCIGELQSGGNDTSCFKEQKWPAHILDKPSHLLRGMLLGRNGYLGKGLKSGHFGTKFVTVFIGSQILGKCL
jgi:hypothetical protein